MELTKEVVRQAFDRNILVFDNDSEPGDCTGRLVALIRTIGYFNGKEDFDILYVGHDVKLNDEHADGEDDICIMSGLPVVRDERLSVDGEFDNYYKTLYGCLAKDHKHMLVAIGKTNIILGSC